MRTRASEKCVTGTVAVAASVLYLMDVGCHEQPIDFAFDFNASIFSSFSIFSV